jgi:hypothetical protein
MRCQMADKIGTHIGGSRAVPGVTLGVSGGQAEVYQLRAPYRAAPAT